jgi:hypothetical protein
MAFTILFVQDGASIIATNQNIIIYSNQNVALGN